MSTEPLANQQSEFVQTAFETTVEDEDVERIADILDSIVLDLRDRFDRDGLLEGVLRREHGRTGIKSGFTVTNQDPEPLTQDLVIEPLLDVLGYDTWYREVSDESDTRGNVADYSIPLTEHDSIDSTQLLIEAEPINKPLDRRGHGIDQVESWLSQRSFQTDFGIATDGVQWILIRYDADTYAHDRIKWADLNEVFLAIFLNQTGKQDPPIEALDEEHIETVKDFYRTFAHPNFLSIAGEAREIIKETQKSITDEFYDTYISAVFGVRKGDTRSERSLIGDGVVPPEDATGEDSRLFAVKLMNRLIFIKFLEDKHIVQEDLLSEIVDTYENGIYPDSMYETFIDRLLFDVMNVRPETRRQKLKSIDLFEGIPYLNGGLFRPHLGENSEVDERQFDVRDSVLKEIIYLLEEYEFSADGGPTDLDPSVLGNIFEKTINYITTDPADQNKELGAYYTPSEITRFSAERTVQPGLYERFKPIVQEELGWPDETFARYDTLYSLIEALPADMAVIGPILDEVNEFRVVDPAMGSGHFLTSVLEEIVSVRKALYAQNDAFPEEFRLRKTTVQNNIYGVDIVGPAVEIGKLRLWLATIADLSEEDLGEFDEGELALPNIAFNLRQGNSLVGYTGFPEESGNGEYTLGKFSEESVKERYHDIITEIEKYDNAIGEEAEKHRQQAHVYLERGRKELIPKIQRDFNNAGVQGISQDEIREFDPFNWVLEFAEVYADGGFDVIVGNPPWDRIKPSRDDFFTRYAPEFRTLRGGVKDEKMEELLENEDIAQEWEKYQQSKKIIAQYYNEGPYQMQSADIGGRTQRTENDLSSLFFERVFEIARDDGYIAQVLPGRIFHGAPTKGLRKHLLYEVSVDALVSFENHGIFDDIDNRYNFGVITFKNAGETDVLKGIFQHRDLDILQNTNDLISIPRQVLTDFSPSSMIFPRIQSEEDLGMLRIAIQHPSIADKERSWYADPFYPLHKTSDKERFFDDSDGCDYEILTGRNFYSYNHDNTFFDLEPPFQWSVNEDVDKDRSAKWRIREKRLPKLKRAIYNQLDGTGSMVSFVNELLREKRGEELSETDVLLPSTTYRIGFRRIARGTDERSMIAAVVPPGPVCDYSFYVCDPFEIEVEQSDLSQSPLHNVHKSVFSDEELFAALGLMNSLPFDFLIRRKIDNSIPMYSFEETQIPDLTHADEWFEYIWSRAAKLNCYGEEFSEMRERLGDIEPVMDESERRELQAEIDAASMLAYGMERDQAVFVVRQYHRVNNPRVRNDEYFNLVLEKYDELM